MKYNFPATKFVNENAPGDQLDHVMSEFQEVMDAVFEKYEDLAEACKDIDVLMEMMDAYQSLETFWRIMAKENGAAFVNNIFARVMTKNWYRGYYRTVKVIGEEGESMETVLLVRIKELETALELARADSNKEQAA